MIECAPDDGGKLCEDVREVVIGEKLVALEQRYFDVNSREQLANASSLVKPYKSK
jgi:hypothetical protein